MDLGFPRYPSRLLVAALIAAAGSQAQAPRPPTHRRGGQHSPVYTVRPGDDIQKIVDAAPDRSTIDFQAGTFPIRTRLGVRLKDRTGLTFQGKGDLTILKRATADEDSRLLTIDGGADLTFRDLSFDVHGIARYGGMMVSNIRNLHIERTHAFDSALKPTWKEFDHYSWVIVGGQDVWVRGVRAEDVELLEIDNVRRGHVLDSTSRRAAGTTAIGSFTVHSGGYLEDVEFLRNTILDPRRWGFMLNHEAGGLSNNTWRNITFRVNRIAVKTPALATQLPLISIGNVVGRPGSGNSYANIALEANQFVVTSATDRPHPDIYIHTQPGEMIRGVRLMKNRFTRAGGGSSFAIGADHVSGLEILGNTVTGGRLGIYLSHFANSSLLDNQVAVSETAYWLVDSLGHNQCQHNGPASARWHTSEAAFRDTDRCER